MITLIGAFAGRRMIGIAGFHLGRLGISYLFELLKAYSTEYDAREASFGEDVPIAGNG